MLPLIFFLWAFALVIPTSGNYKEHLVIVDRYQARKRLGDDYIEVTPEAERDARRLLYAIVLNTIACTMLIPLPVLFAVPFALAGAFLVTSVEFVWMTYVVDFFHRNRPR